MFDLCALQAPSPERKAHIVRHHAPPRKTRRASGQQEEYIQRHHTRGASANGRGGSETYAHTRQARTLQVIGAGYRFLRARCPALLSAQALPTRPSALQRRHQRGHHTMKCARESVTHTRDRRHTCRDTRTPHAPLGCSRRTIRQSARATSLDPDGTFRGEQQFRARSVQGIKQRASRVGRQHRWRHHAYPHHLRIALAPESAPSRSGNETRTAPPNRERR